ncbi:MAG: methylenetetrahydrofolate reductase C-terminal domain-containing protein [Candidatus Latescibacteria bacterium]|nr:methylenetetrahydrofolate reductase C-terminal domain-containing protein [Candidatus Latescibacterota bacterium]
MQGNVNTFRSLIDATDTFVITCEHTLGRISRGKKLDETVEFAAKGRETGLVHAVSLTDNPGGAPAISPDIVAMEIERTGMPAIVHFSAKDMNRNQLESRALFLDRAGVRNVLVMSGDYQTLGQAGLPMPVFDMDPVHILTVLNLLNHGVCIDQADRSLQEHQATDFFTGAVVSPYKFTEAGTMLQFYKMEKKYRAGARYFITQFGFDARKLRDFMAFTREHFPALPVLGSVFILRKGAARRMNRGDIPGAFVTDELLKAITVESAADDKGRAASLERAAMQVAVLRGLGFRGAHIEAMILRFDMVETILGRAKELAPDWEECAGKLSFAPKGSYYLGARHATASSPATGKLRRGWLIYRVMRLLHTLLFKKNETLSPLMKSVSRLLDSSKTLGAVSHFLERASKTVLFDCRNCGDCALPELKFLCPQSQCPKQQRNGPCGGSRLDACEVYPDRPCVWHRAYERAKAFGELEELRGTIVGPKDWSLDATSGWVNFHLDRDHTSYDFGAFFETAREGERNEEK